MQFAGSVGHIEKFVEHNIKTKGEFDVIVKNFFVSRIDDAVSVVELLDGIISFGCDIVC